MIHFEPGFSFFNCFNQNSCIVLISAVSNGAAVWYAVGVAELISFLCAMFITRRSERGGVRFSED